MVPLESVHSRRQVTVTLLAVIGLVLQVPSVLVPLTWHTASVVSVLSTVVLSRRLHDLLDRALRALLERELAAVGVAHVDDADDVISAKIGATSASSMTAAPRSLAKQLAKRASIMRPASPS